MVLLCIPESCQFERLTLQTETPGIVIQEIQFTFVKNSRKATHKSNFAGLTE